MSLPTFPSFTSMSEHHANIPCLTITRARELIKLITTNYLFTCSTTIIFTATYNGLIFKKLTNDISYSYVS